MSAGLSTQAQGGTTPGAATDWLHYGGDKAGSKYSPLAQIDGSNFTRLKVAWTWRSAEENVVKAIQQALTTEASERQLVLDAELAASINESRLYGGDDVLGAAALHMTTVSR